MSSEPVIEARGLGKAYQVYRRPEDRLKQFLWGRWRRYYQEFWALQGVDLAVARGETLGVIGQNGSGKSTLLQLICGTLRPSAGEVRVQGRVAALLELGAGFNPEFTGRENVGLSAAVLGLSAAEIAERFDAIADFADIGGFMDQPMKHYSSGMYARLAFSVCAHVDADILIVDEILAVGDAAFQQKCMRYLNRFRQRGTLLFVSHDSGAVVKLCERSLWLERGQIREFGDSKEICRRYMAAQAEEMAEDPGRFQIGGRSKRLKPASLAVQAENAEPEDSDRIELFAFDADGHWHGQGGAKIEAVEFYTEDGARLQVVVGGEAVELRIACRAQRKVARPVVAFVLRDRLGQILFGDDTYPTYGGAPPIIVEDQSFRASFHFSLPYLSSGAYAVEAFLFDGSAASHIALDRARDAEFLHVHSRHIFPQGLANIAMRDVSVAIAEAMPSGTTADLAIGVKA